MAKILLVEDDNNLREIYQARLQAEGYDIVAARDGEEALVVAKQELPNLVISDVMMPKISGFEMLDILRNTDGLKDVKVIMLTALGQSEDQSRADALGADRYLVKSQVTLEDIVNAASELLNGNAPAEAPAPVEEAAPAPTPEVAAPAPTVTPVEVAPEPVADEAPVTEPAPEASVIPVAAPPAEEVAVEPVMPSMPPTPVSTLPAEEAEAPAPVETPVAPEAVPVETPTPAEAPAPVEEAAPAPTPEVATAPTTAIPVTDASEGGMQSEAQEAAVVEQQIADFVQSQSGQAPLEAPVVEPVPVETPTPAEAPAPVEEAAPAPTPEVATPAEAVPPTETTTSEQEQALADAVTNLSGGENTEAAPAEAPAPTEESPSVTGRKVIEPIAPSDAAQKKSLDDLLAEQEAKDAQTNAVPAPNPQPSSDDFDPNSIAL